MSQTRYRKDISTTPAHPSDNDYYAIGIYPPVTQDDAYCRVRVHGRSWGRSGRRFDARSEAIDYIHNTLDGIEAKALDDKRRGSINHYPEPPKPSNTRYVVHPDYDGEIGPREIWGDATLGSFGVTPQSRFETEPWYQTRDSYTNWGKPLSEGDVVLRLFGRKHRQDTFWWFTVSGDTLHMIEYRIGGPLINITESTWTRLTRQVGGIGLTNSEPLDCRHLPVGKTPFRVGLDEKSIQERLLQHPPDPPVDTDSN